MANSSDWIEAIGRQGTDAGPDAKATQPGWIATLGLGEPDAPGGFRGASPFASGLADAENGARQPPRKAEPIAPADEEAYLRGYSDGHAEAKRLGDTQLAEHKARYRDLRASIRALDAAALEALTQDLSATVLSLCEQVLGDYAVDPQALAERCRASAKRLGKGPGDLTLHLHPDTRAALDPEAFAGWNIEEDAELSPGALRLSNAEGAVRDGPEDWTRALAEALRA